MSTILYFLAVIDNSYRAIDVPCLLFKTVLMNSFVHLTNFITFATHIHYSGLYHTKIHGPLKYYNTIHLPILIKKLYIEYHFGAIHLAQFLLNLQGGIFNGESNWLFL